MDTGGYDPCCLPVRKMSEDCLQLNIFSPDTKTPHPVLVYIHGGGYIHGMQSETIIESWRCMFSALNNNI
jgi:para-nitrobenzyl esterase